jgi:hypothetical protein
MIEILLGIVCGMIVCTFGMWCFIHGQHNAYQLYHNELPQQLSNPVRAAVDGVQAMRGDTKKDQEDPKDFAEQLSNLMNYNPELEKSGEDE